MKRYPLPPIRRRRLAPNQAANYQQTVAMLAACNGLRAVTGPVSVTVAVYRHRQSADLVDFLVAVCAAVHDDRHEPHVEIEVVSCRD